jgi:pimeloyl-ACP methyl ester carboxylesterase
MRKYFYMTCLLSVWLMTIFLFTGCTFFRLESELVQLEEIKVLSGAIVGRTNLDSTVLIVLLEKDEKGLHLSKASVLAPGSEKFAIEANIGRFLLLAFEDLNSNLAFDPYEPAGVYGKSADIDVFPGTPQTITGLDIDISGKAGIEANLGSKISLSPEALGSSFIKLGQVIDLNDPILSMDYAWKGYWEPLTFIREIGFCIYFFEPYDADKIPVLFVHGALGSPAVWQKAIEYLDRQRFQPWFFYYPSGLPLEKISSALNKMVIALQRHHGFQEMHVVAHSMGGIVARDFLLQNWQEQETANIRSFLSISTPWNGHRMTAKGVESAPTAVPSWHDMVPESDFFRKIYSRKLPSSLHHYLFFGYRGDCSLFLGNNDGTVEIESQLDWRAQKEAKRIFGYNEDHLSILEAEAVLLQMQALLAAESQRSEL